MKITKDNIESYLLDYLEGSLTESELHLLETFLISNPRYAPDDERGELLSLIPDLISYPSKDKLKKELPDSNAVPVYTNFEFFAIAYLEGDLNLKQRADFELFLSKHPELKEEFALLSRARLKGEKVTYSAKGRLKKKRSGSFFRILLPVAAAASIALLLLVYTNRIQNVAVSESVEIKTEIPPVQDQDFTDTEQGGQAAEESSLNDADNEQVSMSEVIPQEPPQNLAHPESQPLLEEERNRTISGNADDKIKIDQKIDIGKMMANNEMIKEFSSEPASIKSFAYEPYQPYTENQKYMVIARKDVGEIIDEIRNEDLSLLNIASHGINGVNKLAGTDMKLLASKDADGEVSRFEFTSKRLKISAPLQKSKNEDDY